jgi:hypothetical protein
MALLRGVSIEPGRAEVAPPQYLDFDLWHRCPFYRRALAARWVKVRGKLMGMSG